MRTNTGWVRMADGRMLHVSGTGVTGDDPQLVQPAQRLFDFVFPRVWPCDGPPVGVATEKIADLLKAAAWHYEQDPPIPGVRY